MTDTATIRVERIMPAPPAEVFDEWLDPDALTEWMCPRPSRVVGVDLDPRVDGILRFDVDDEGTRVLITGQFLEIDRPHLLRFTWSNSNWPDPTVTSVVEVRFTPAGESDTHMAIEHRLVPATEFDDFHNGWTLTAEQLVAVLAARASRGS
ncbi:SRPBCC domain-containing protein [Mycobacterium sp. PS03-16]|uniref:SRPBCC family protein n=1 Tax=Mycobacterium sp. PS03-16 TaxID=2559611 RepID=UPI001073C1D0|nr:SRPBCC domain-containing protein [Mycobacterium sp. PS03-16]TFV54892.1 SRPBCC domain-containing protein [Mycobacterium sp. PS03-16]